MASEKKNLTPRETDRYILELITREPIRDQKELLVKIQAVGGKMNQSTLSRRLKALGVIKKNGAYMSSEVAKTGIKDLLRRIDVSLPNLLVAHTLTGHAQALAFQLDHISNNVPDSVESGNETGFSEIMGTIAGDDTVLIVCKNEENLMRLKNKLDNIWV